MYRGPSIGGGVVLAVIGAILAFAVKDAFNGVDLQLIGYILLAAGAILIVLGVVMGMRSATTERTVHRGPEGEHERIDTRGV